MHPLQLSSFRCVQNNMSRAFVKEDDSGEPPIIPPRAALPAGVTNYVTPNGLALLRKELSILETERAKIEANHQDEADRTRQLTIFNSRLAALNERIASAKVVDLRSQPADEIRFGATATLHTRQGSQSGQRTFTIVGVDEASVSEGRVAFVAPIARAVIGARLGQYVTLQMGSSKEIVEVMGISYHISKDLPNNNAQG